MAFLRLVKDLLGTEAVEGFKGSPSKSQFAFLLAWIFKTKKVDSLSLSLPPVLGLSWLKDLRMENCNLSCLPNEVGNLISLETLDLGKNKLCTLPDSICNLTRLKKLYLSNCDVLHLPNEIGRLVTLKTLILEGNSLLTLPDSICNLTHLEELNLSQCDVSHLPDEIGRLISLKSLNLRQNNLLTLPDSFCNLAFLSDLDLKDCNLSHLPDRIGMLSSLMNLNLERNNVCSLPNSFSDLGSLEKVYLSNCRSLQSLPELPASLERLHLNYCGRLQSLPELPVSLRNMDARHCTLLESIPTEFNWQAGLSMLLEGCDMLAKNNFANNVMERIDQSLSEDKKDREWSDASVYQRMINISLPGDEVPNWFEYQCTGSKLSLVVPPLVTRTILGYSLCIVYRTHENRGCLDYPMTIIRNKPTAFRFSTFSRHQDQDQMILLYFPSDCGRIHGGDELEIEIKQATWLTVKKCGINLVYEDNTEMPIKKKRKITDTRDPDISSLRN
ncbi:hypothetical protein RHSIM_Rhsim13G0019800 [Rhododendron simsii]|uniref:Uncharacterized protein n=1 Tax=Rhododendron simsii TaxID=118357 RepID=A0A834FYZ6_RHOSS|nr:hypothetical protein RHSIM_Rhsim13G0019800 [Rhododendron simsii]